MNKRALRAALSVALALQPMVGYGQAPATLDRTVRDAQGRHCAVHHEKRNHHREPGKEDEQDDAQPAQPIPDEKAWAFSASVFTYLLPDESNYAQPTFTADRDWLHLEARYNYEDLHTGSVWLGYNFSFGDEVAFDFTPMFGVVFGDTDGVAPGYKAALRWRKLDLCSESEYVFDAGDSSESFLYAWSELGWSPVDWLRLGLVVQRTKVYKTEFNVQRGFLVGVAYKNASFTTYVFNPDARQPTVVLGISLDF